MADAGRLTLLMASEDTQAIKRPLRIWRLLDGKPGHESQTLGLVSAMQQRYSATEVFDVSLKHQKIGFWHWLLKRFPLGENLPAPDVIVGAGHRTHWGLLAARRAYGGKAIALMSPSLPLFCFDFVVSPVHDNVHGSNVIETRGVINPMRPGLKKPRQTLILLGGVSKHFAWHDQQVLEQVNIIMSAFPAAIITDSRRTPEPLREHLRTNFGDQYQPWEKCPPGWMAQSLAQTQTVWVTEDSVSMIYESLSAGCHVGLIGLAAGEKGSDRLVKGIESLIADGYLVRLKSQPLSLSHPPQKILNEAERVAFLLLSQLGKDFR